MKKIIYPFLFLLVLTGCKKEKEENKEDSPLTQGAPHRYVRKNIYSEDAKKDVEALEKALAIMQKTDCSDPLSWYYQGAMHWIPEEINGKNKLCSSYQTYKDLKAAWDNCTHTEDGAEEIHFLVWHRMYTYHFEKIVRKVSGYSDFALPYWGYTNVEDSLKNRTMPERYRDKASALYQAARLDSLLNGIPISGNATRKLSLTKLNENHSYALYNKNIDRAPHGAMHNYIGFGNDTLGKRKYNNVWQQDTYGMMSEVATAAFDPIFWVHHANIDRIWQQWTNSPNGQKVLLEELKKVPWSYVFFDENGKKVEYTIEEVVDMLYNMDYDYDDTKVYAKEIPKNNLLVFSVQDFTKGDTLSATTKKIALNKDIKISLPNTKGRNVKLLSKSNKKGEILILSVTVSFVKAPKGDFEVYLNLPTNVKATPENKYFAGFMTFFGADHKHGVAHNANKPHRITKTFSFEITEEAMDTDALNKSAFDISIIKFDGSRADDIQIDKIAVLKQ